MIITEMESIVLDLCLVLHYSDKPMYHMWRIAERRKKLSKCPQVIRILNRMKRDLTIVETVREISDASYPN